MHARKHHPFVLPTQTINSNSPASQLIGLSEQMLAAKPVERRRMSKKFEGNQSSNWSPVG
ncbi:hypothetical protein BDQ94DRAFT_143581 [Aspergillus welwitschiae]|uniref:Uncharacterized protein n=1 Tax=Aspergillus welwitschiae TaxID=1341132 RepID=A0A3F3Q3A9_9EURO|nr:hypothetical protein BDQ94DRAFT_143581 [Aspergillus welwitschiae]RDH33689.1 hypothetical protein BDQ94DRAFT_143581 [Aspergillus welwitschiae]